MHTPEMQRFFSVFLWIVFGITGFTHAGIIAPPEKLQGDAQMQFEKLKEAALTDSRKALSLCGELYRYRQSLSEKNKVWVSLHYAKLLLENDSIGKASDLLTELQAATELKDEPELEAFLILNVGTANTFNGDYRTADSLYRAALAQAKMPALKADILQALADNLRFEDKYDASYTTWLEALVWTESLNDSSEVYECLLGIGKIELLRGEFEKAESHFSTFFAYSKNIQNRKKEAAALSMLGLLDLKQGRYERSIDRSLQAYQIRSSINDIKGQGESLNNLALAYMEVRNWSQALRYLEDALYLKLQANDLTQMTAIFNDLGSCYLKMGNVKNAEEYFQRALNKGSVNGQFSEVIRSYGNLISIYTNSRQDFKTAFEFQTQLMALKDSLADAKRKETIQELEVRYETQRKEREIELLQQERTLITNRWLTLALGLFFAIIVVLLFYDNQRRKHAQEKKLLTAEEELQRTELKIMSGLLEHNQQKLSLYTENLLRKNELVGRLEDKLKDVLEKENGEDGKAIIENVSSVRILTDQDWEEFKQLFDGVHRGLLDRLLLKHDNLTLAEQRLFLLMKLSMSTKEMANILGVSPDSVKKGRYRLKKKLGLNEDISLQEFVDAF